MKIVTVLLFFVIIYLLYCVHVLETNTDTLKLEMEHDRRLFSAMVIDLVGNGTLK